MAGGEGEESVPTLSKLLCERRRGGRGVLSLSADSVAFFFQKTKQ